MVLGKLPVPGRPTIRITVGQGPTALAVVAVEGRLDIFTLIYPFSPFSPSLREMARYRLKYCLKGPLSPKQPTNHPVLLYIDKTSRDCKELKLSGYISWEATLLFSFSLASVLGSTL